MVLSNIDQNQVLQTIFFINGSLFCATDISHASTSLKDLDWRTMYSFNWAECKGTNMQQNMGLGDYQYCVNHK